MRKKYFYCFRLAFLLMVFSLSSCDAVKNWQKDYLAKRYGTAQDSKQQIEKWQEEAAEYQKEVEKKIVTAKKAAAVHHSLANAFAAQEAWQLCVNNLQQAIVFGDNGTQTLFDLATCQGNLARSKNWDYKLTRETENTLLSILEKDPTSVQARYRLALVYFYGYGQNSRYRVLSQVLTVEQKDFQKKAMSLLQEAAKLDAHNSRVFHLIAVIYSAWGERQSSLDALNQEINILRQENPDTYSNGAQYKQALKSIETLGGTSAQ